MSIEEQQRLRGDALYEARRLNLELIHQQYSWEELANRCDVDPVYLSQIANHVVQKAGKKPRRLSDAYAEKIESGLGLPTGWFDIQRDSVGIASFSKSVQYPSDIREVADALARLPFEARAPLIRTVKLAASAAIKRTK